MSMMWLGSGSPSKRIKIARAEIPHHLPPLRPHPMMQPMAGSSLQHDGLPALPMGEPSSVGVRPVFRIAELSCRSAETAGRASSVPPHPPAAGHLSFISESKDMFPPTNSCSSSILQSPIQRSSEHSSALGVHMHPIPSTPLFMAPFRASDSRLSHSMPLPVSVPAIHGDASQGMLLTKALPSASDGLQRPRSSPARQSASSANGSSPTPMTRFPPGRRRRNSSAKPA
jgi:hypothetical protein